jgi:hypothetical protein
MGFSNFLFNWIDYYFLIIILTKYSIDLDLFTMRKRCQRAYPGVIRNSV